MELVEIPREVIFNNLFPYLQLNDLLRLRRVCKFLKPLADDYIRVHGVTTQRSIPINLREGSSEILGDFLSLNIPIPVTRVYIENKSGVSWDTEEVQRFLEIYGNQITHVTVHLLNVPMYVDKVKEFFEALPNLEHLYVSHVQGQRVDSVLGLYIPSTFKRLKSLHIEQFFPLRPSEEDVKLVWKFIEECSPRLESVKHPYIDCEGNGNLPGRKFGCIRRIIKGRHEKFPDEPNLKFYNMINFSEENNRPTRAREFYSLVTTCYQHNVKLLNVDANLIEGMMQLETWDMEDHGKKLNGVIMSLHYLHKTSFLLELPHLEKILLGEEHGIGSNCSMPSWEFQPPSWANLKELEIWMDSPFFKLAEGEPIVKSSKLLNFFFTGIKREKMETLKIHFLPEYQPRSSLANLTPMVPHPRTKDICSSCPNLRFLTIGYWPGSNKAISRLWENLPLLEMVKFESCKSLADRAFIGQDSKNPSFLKLKKLKMLKFDALTKMPLITDKLFTDVLRHMPLKKLHLKGWGIDNLKSVTVAGIRSLLTGVFAETIEEFSLEGRVIFENVSAEEIRKLEQKFRCSKLM